MADKVSISCYGKYPYSGGGYGAHCMMVTVGEIDLYFSYQTCIAFRTPGFGLVCSQNNWSTTTGKHLNWVQPDKTKRVSDFDKRLNEILAKYNLAI